MARGYEEASTSQAVRKRGTPRETPTASSLVSAMSVEELRSFSQVHIVIRLEVSKDTVVPTIGGADNVVYFIREQFAAGLRFPIPYWRSSLCTSLRHLLHLYIRTSFGF